MAIKDDFQIDELWSSWNNRLSQFVTSGVTKFSPERLDMFAAAQQTPAYQLLPLNLGKARAHNWSQLMLRALAQSDGSPERYVPAWMIFPAIKVLHLNVDPQRLYDMLHKVTDFGRIEKEVVGWMHLMEPSREANPQALFVVTPDSITGQWPTPERFGALVVDMKTMEEYQRSLNLLFFELGLRMDFIIVEHPIDPLEAHSLLGESFESEFLIMRRGKDEPKYRSHREIIDPSDYDDSVRRYSRSLS